LDFRRSGGKVSDWKERGGSEPILKRISHEVFKLTAQLPSSDFGPCIEPPALCLVADHSLLTSLVVDSLLIPLDNS